MLVIPESFKLVKKRAWTQDEHHTKESFLSMAKRRVDQAVNTGRGTFHTAQGKASHTLTVDGPLLSELPIFLFLPITAAAPCRTQLGPAGASSLPQGMAGPSCRDCGAS